MVPIDGEYLTSDLVAIITCVQSLIIRKNNKMTKALTLKMKVKSQGVEERDLCHSTEINRVHKGIFHYFSHMET